MQLYADRWQTLRQGALSYLSMSEVISNQVLRIGQATVTTQGIPPAGQRKPRIRTMETWLHDRANWLDRQFPSPPTINIVGGTTVAANSAVRISANKGVIYDTTDGSDSRNDHRFSNKATVIHPRNSPPLLSMKAP